MKFFLSALFAATLCLCSSDSLSAQNSAASAVVKSSASTLVVQVTGIRNSKGEIRLLVFSGQDGWPDVRDQSFRHASLAANGRAVTFTLTNMPEGRYALSVLHDENENHKLDRDLFGRPKEGIGFGNNPKIGFTKPGWKDASVQVNGPSMQTTIDLRYP